MLNINKSEKTQQEMSTMNNLTKVEKAQQKFEKVDAIEKATNTEGFQSFKGNTTFLITDYTQLNHIDNNRIVQPNQKLFKDLEKYGQCSPVMVKKDESDGKYFVLNGQHRLHYLKELGLPVICIEIGGNYTGNNKDAVKSDNIKNRNWSKADFGKHYRNEGNENFISFKDVMDDSSILSETIVYTYVTGKKGNLKRMYEDGTLDFKPTEDQKKNLKILDELIKSISISRKDNRVLSYFDKPQIFATLVEFISEKEYDLDKLQKSLKKDGYTLDRSSSVETIESIYQNYQPNEKKTATN